MKIILVFCFLAFTLSAESVIIGTPQGPFFEQSNELPFADYLDGITTYQQVYSSTAFPGAISISSISFFLSPSAGIDNELYPQTITISLSTTSIGVDHLYYHAPQGSDAQTFGTFRIGGTSPEILTFQGSPFLYNPLKGNLLVQIGTPFLTPPYTEIDNALFESDDSGALTSRFCDETECNEDQGLVTEFSSAIPEPSSAFYTFLGAAGLYFAVRRPAGRGKTDAQLLRR
jgi:hypothetical protein